MTCKDVLYKHIYNRVLDRAPIWSCPASEDRGTTGISWYLTALPFLVMSSLGVLILLFHFICFVNEMSTTVFISFLFLWLMSSTCTHLASWVFSCCFSPLLLLSAHLSYSLLSPVPSWFLPLLACVILDLYKRQHWWLHHQFPLCAISSM